MLVKKRLHINIAASAVTALLIVLLLFLGLNRIYHSMEELKVSGEILSSSFERNAFRSDYLRNNNERAKLQWFARHERLGILLNSASEKFKEAEEKATIDEMIKDHVSSEKIFKAIVENREKIISGVDSPAISRETENRLVTQLDMKLYDRIIHVRSLRDSARMRLFSAVNLAGWGIIILITLVALGGILNSWSMGRTITDRIGRLRRGASVVGAGDLDFRIAIKGDDEFAELSGAIDAMTEKLQAAYRDLEGEIAARRLIEDALKQNERYLETIIENAPACVKLVGEDGTLLKMNRAGLKILEADVLDQVQGKSIYPLVSSQYRRAFMNLTKEVFQGGEGTLEFEAVGLKGKPIWLNTHGVPLYDHAGKITALLGITVDITERKRAEEERERLLADLARSNGELEQFAYVASHDLQEPLRIVASYVQLLAQKYKGRLDEKADKYIYYMVDGAERMRKLIEGLLAYSRITRRGAEFGPVDLNKIFSLAVSNLTASIQESNGVVTKDGLPTLPGDETQLIQLFQNLIGNGVKYRKPGAPPRVHVTAKREGREWVFSVRDNGIGIEPQYFDRIFQIFQRLHTREEYSGTGIGLALCKRIVERHQGRIWIESVPGEGSTFFFTMRERKI